MDWPREWPIHFANELQHPFCGAAVWLGGSVTSEPSFVTCEPCLDKMTVPTDRWMFWWRIALWGLGAMTVATIVELYLVVRAVYG